MHCSLLLEIGCEGGGNLSAKMENYKHELQPCLKAFQTAVQCNKFCDM
jgi:hypothetical protein